MGNKIEKLWDRQLTVSVNCLDSFQYYVQSQYDSCCCAAIPSKKSRLPVKGQPLDPVTEDHP